MSTKHPDVFGLEASLRKPRLVRTESTLVGMLKNLDKLYLDNDPEFERCAWVLWPAISVALQEALEVVQHETNEVKNDY